MKVNQTHVPIYSKHLFYIVSSLLFNDITLNQLDFTRDNNNSESFNLQIINYTLIFCD